MAVTLWNERFFESSRGRVLALLRRGSQTVDELAAAIGVSDNAVRPHLASLERDGIVRQRGVRPTGPGGGKPAYIYEVAPAAEQLFTKAYIPVLTQLVSVLEERMTPEALETLLREVGRRVGAASSPRMGDLRARAESAAAVLTELGGVVDVEESDGALLLRGYACPLADAVRAHPSTCHLVESLVLEIVGRPVRECCEKGDRPRCRFLVASSPLGRAVAISV